MKQLENIRLFFQGAFDFKRMSSERIGEVLQEEVDDFLFICFSENMGIPLPISYYTLELLPYLEEEMASWELRMTDKDSIWESRVTECPL